MRHLRAQSARGFKKSLRGNARRNDDSEHAARTRVIGEQLHEIVNHKIGIAPQYAVMLAPLRLL